MSAVTEREFTGLNEDFWNQFEEDIKSIDFRAGKVFNYYSQQPLIYLNAKEDCKKIKLTITVVHDIDDDLFAEISNKAKKIIEEQLAIGTKIKHQFWDPFFCPIDF